MTSVLLVEDDEAIREMMTRLLTWKGYQVTCVGNGRAGVEQAEQDLPDVILMDISLPEMDGWEATRHLKASAATRAIPIIALTAHAMVGDRQKCLAAGCDDYMAKPVNVLQLVAKIDTLIKDRQPTPES